MAGERHRVELPGESARRQANHWLTKCDAGLMTAEDEALLRAWLAEDPAHAEAWARVQAIFDALGAVSPIGPACHGSPARRRWRRDRRRGASASSRPYRIGAAVAASLLLVSIAGEPIAIRLQADAIAPVGPPRQVALPDGSTAVLDSGAAIAFRSGGQRGARLLRGQAAFTVAADPAHPFVVEARGGSTTALGTRFIVSRIDPVTRITVTEHAVRVTFDGGARIVRAGSSTTYDAQGIAVPHSVRVADADAWTRNTLRFVNRPLREVVAELGRYHSGYIRVVGSRIGDMPVNGAFSTSDPVAAVDTIERSLGLGSYRLGDGVILLHD